MQLLTDYFDLQQQIFDYFGYKEDWRVIPLDDCRRYYWRLRGEGPGTVCYATTEAHLDNETGEYYESDIYTQRFLPKWVYRGEHFTMICTDPRVDNNQFLSVFRNENERPLTTKENHDS